jgi:membrane fusion protein (multidrug efflux system)
MEIPRRAVFNNDMVYVVSDNTLRKAEINILRINQESMIFNGLEEGEHVVVEPLINVAEGSLVEIY